MTQQPAPPDLYLPRRYDRIIAAFIDLTRSVHANAVAKGFHDTPRLPAVDVALMHSELSEMLEALRAGDPDSVKIPGHSQAAEELADLVIRALDYAGAHNINLGAAILAKHQHNISRPHRHGKEF